MMVKGNVHMEKMRATVVTMYHLSDLHYSVDYIGLYFGIMDSIVEL